MQVQNLKRQGWGCPAESAEYMDRTIFHIDVNSAFLSWEAAYRIYHLGGKLDLRTVPAAVAGSIKMRHGIILAKSIPAKPYGISTGMTVVEARQKCPDICLVPPNYDLYQTCSRALLDLISDYTPDIEVYSIDEAFADMTETLHLFGSPQKTADEIRNRVREELGFTVNVGISTNKVLAKMASELKKPDLTQTLYPEEIPEKLWPLPVSKLFFCGRSSTRKLMNMGIRTVGELAGTAPDLLRYQMGKQGELLWNFANGQDSSAVITHQPAQKGFGNSTTAPADVTDAGTARMILLGLAETVGTRLRKAGEKAEVLSVGIRNFQLQHASHQMRLENPTNDTLELYRAACRLFTELWTEKIPIRQMGLHATRLQDGNAPRQLNLFDQTDYVKLEKLDETVDQIRRRFGNDSLMRAVFLTQEEQEGVRRIDHMEGGISREKREVNYAEIDIQ